MSAGNRHGTYIGTGDDERADAGLTRTTTSGVAACLRTSSTPVPRGKETCGYTQRQIHESGFACGNVMFGETVPVRLRFIEFGFLAHVGERTPTGKEDFEQWHLDVMRLFLERRYATTCNKKCGSRVAVSILRIALLTGGF